MVVKADNGNEDWAGMLLTLRGVRIESVDGLSFGQSDNDMSTFTISGKVVDFSATPGSLATPAGWAGTITNLIG